MSSGGRILDCLLINMERVKMNQQLMLDVHVVRKTTLELVMFQMIYLAF